MEHPPYRRYPVNFTDYKLYEEIGEGMSATVYRALCVPLNEIVAIKVIDLEKCKNDLDDIRREVHTMCLIDNPKVLRALCSFTAGQSLCVVMPYMAAGSCLHIMKTRYPDGFEEPVIATLLHETLMALDYLHSHGHIHRDVKAGNILIDSNGTVKLADFGVSACMFDTGDRHRARNTFVGTPCWMAPEVVHQNDYYDSRVDIWSFGITAIELAHGHAPCSNLPPYKVFVTTLASAPPRLDYERDKKFSKSFKDMVDTCLKKDPKQRPTTDKLLKHSFFKGAKTREYLARTILKGLQPLGQRFKADEAGLNKACPIDAEHLSQQKCIKAVSAWNFNLEELKNQASLIQDNESSSSQENVDRPSPDMTNESNSGVSYEDGYDVDSLKSSHASFPIQPLLLKGGFDIGRSCEESVPSDSELESIPNETHQTATNNFGSVSRDTSLPLDVSSDQSKKIPSRPLSLENVIEHRGRFKVTSTDLSPKGSTSSVSTLGSGNSATQVPQNVSAASVLSSLQLILHQIDIQRDEIIKLIKCLEQFSGSTMESADAATSDVRLSETKRNP
ncbi:hypothetical protein V2J09_008748 [Rumex salicifolius]